MPTPEELAFIDDPVEFMKNDIVRVSCGKTSSGVMNFRLVLKGDIAKKKNRRGRAINYYYLQQDDNGDIEAHYLSWQDKSVKSTGLSCANDAPALMVTANMNGCSFGYSLGAGGDSMLVSHHNDREHGNDVDNIEAQAVDGLDPNTDHNYFHQTGYRKVRDGNVDQDYKGTVFGVREGQDWKFYAQMRKDLYGAKNTSYWTLKGVVEINP